MVTAYNGSSYDSTIPNFTIDGSKITSLYGINCKFFEAGE